VDRSRTGGCLADRSSCPHHQPRRLTASEEAPILRARRETNLGPARLAALVRRPRSTIWKVLWRNGVSVVAGVSGRPSADTSGHGRVRSCTWT
jgi:hypothetical protein